MTFAIAKGMITPDPVLDYYRIFQKPEPKKVSFMKSFFDHLTFKSIEATKELDASLDHLITVLRTAKLKEDLIIERLEGFKMAEGLINSFLNLISQYNNDDPLTDQLIKLNNKLLEKNQLIISTLITYLEVIEARKEIEEGRGISIDQLLNEL